MIEKINDRNASIPTIISKINEIIEVINNGGSNS